MAEETDSIRVLVIDGSRNVRDFVAEQVLLPNGYKPILARDGVEGLRLALAEIPDAILMDFELPMMSGRDVLESLHSRPLQIPVILMTSRGTEQVAVRLIRMGVRDYLLKPFTADELLQSLERVLFEVQLRRESTELAKQLTFANRRLKQCLLEFNVVSQMGRAVTAQMPLDDFLERIVDAALYITQSEECVLMLNDSETAQPTARVAKRRVGAITRPLSHYPIPDPDRPGAVAAMLHIPLKVGTDEIGVLGVSNKTRPRSFNDHERQLLGVLADYAAMAIENTQLLRQVDQTADIEQDAPAEV
jgi:two-component system NtrC family sensor kinase